LRLLAFILGFILGFALGAATLFIVKVFYYQNHTFVTRATITRGGLSRPCKAQPWVIWVWFFLRMDAWLFFKFKG
jgi:hypothetical protein